MSRKHVSILTATVLYLYLPIVMLAIFAFSEDEVIAFPITGVTVRWFTELSQNQPFIDGLLTSLRIAVPVGLVTATLGLFAALAVRSAVGPERFAWWVVPFILLLTIPFLTPKTVLGIAQSMAISELGLRRGPFVLGFSQALTILPFATALIAASLLRVDPRLEEAARDLGATPQQSFWRVLFPLICGAFIAAISVGVILSLADLVLANFLSGRAQPLSKVVASEFIRELKPDINAMQVVLLSVTAALVIAGEAFRSWRR